MQEDKFFRELLDLTKENNRILRNMNFQRKVSNGFWIFKWILIALVAYSAYTAAVPYIQSAQQTMDSINNLNSQAQQMQQSMNQQNITDFITNKFRNVMPK